MRRLTLALATMVFALFTAATAGAATINATPATFASAVSQAQSGDTILLSSGNYGTWSGTNKAITVKADSGANPTMRVGFSTGDSGFTLDGISGLGGDIDDDAHDITIKNSTTDSTIKIPGDRSGPVVFDNVHFDANGCTDRCSPSLWIGPGSTAHDTKVIVRNSLFTRSPGDGIQSGSAFTVTDSEFNVTNTTCNGCHTDALQLYSGQAGDGTGSTILRNYFHDGGPDSAGITQYDGGGHNIIEDNVVAREALFGIVQGGDTGSRIVHNTVVGGRGGIDFTSKAVNCCSHAMTIRDNVTPFVALDSGGSPAAFDHNMIPGGSGQNFSGSPIFVGGANPTTYAGFALAANSPGKGRASDGLDVGVRFGGAPPPPPPPPNPQCSDGVDNSDPEDTIADYPADPGCTSASDNDETDIVPPPNDNQPVARFTASPEPSAPRQQVTFDGTATTCADTPCTYRYNDDVNGALLGSSRTSTFTFQNPGTKQVRLTVTDADGDVNSVEHDHVVANTPPPDTTPVARFTASPEPSARGQQVTFDAATTTCADVPCTYVWEDDGSDGPGGTQWALGTGRTLTFTFNNIGTKHVRLTVTDADGDSNSILHDHVVR